ncbi:MAG: hypothetical protein ABIP95_03250 [Pelobium sp.]
MNNTFNLKRFGLLIKRHWLEYGKIQLITLGIVAGVILLIYGFTYFGLIKNSFSNNSLNYTLKLSFREPLFVILGLLLLTIATSQHFAPMGQKPKAIIELTLPASTLEKFLIGLLFSVILTILTYLLLFYLIDLAFVSKLKNMYQYSEVDTTTSSLVEVVNKRIQPSYFFERNFKLLPKPFYVVPFFISSIFLLGSIYFNKFQYLKTMICLMVFFGIWGTFLAYTGEAIFNNLTMIRSAVDFNDGTKLEWGFTILLTVISMVLWAIAYVRLREKEV